MVRIDSDRNARASALLYSLWFTVFVGKKDGRTFQQLFSGDLDEMIESLNFKVKRDPLSLP